MTHKDHAPRILGGRLRGRALAVAPGRVTRPLKALARRSLFDILGPRIEGARVLDLFAGAGTVGLEAVSRGAAAVVLVESAPEAQRALARSIESLGVASIATIATEDAEQFVSAHASADVASFDIVFVGPPYRLFEGDARAGLSRVLRGTTRLVAADGTLILECKTVTAPPDLPELTAVDLRRYGETALHFFVPRDPTAPQAAPPSGR